MTSRTNATELTALSLAEAAALLRSRKVSPVELTRACLEQVERLNPKLNAFITVTADSAMEQARTAEAQIQRGRWRGPLHGIPVGLKDLVDTAGLRTTAASALFKDRVPESDAAVVVRLKRAGAVLLGKLNLHEFAYGGSGIISYFGPVLNPWNVKHITGGSSSGSAAAVSAGMCYAAIGTDTAGSIRLPAACCGIVGLKPTYGLVSARGVVPLSWSYDHVGPMTRTVHDAAVLLEAIAGYDAGDIHSRKTAVRGYSERLHLPRGKRLRIGLPGAPFWNDLEPDVAARAEKAVGVLRKLRCEIREVEVPVDSDRTVMRAEVFAYHASWVETRPGEYQPATLKRINDGEEYTASQYILRQRELDVTRRRVDEIFKTVDVLVMPTSPMTPPALATLQKNPHELRETELQMLRNTRPFNVLGAPAISLPCGLSAAGLPVGLQIAAAPGRDDLVLAVAHAYEQHTRWHAARPKMI